MRNERLTHGEETAESRELLWLLGVPHLSDYLDFVQTRVAGGQEQDPKRLADEWRRANDHLYHLEQVEAGIADAARCLPLPADMRPLARKARASAYFKEAFDALPARFCMVELDRLIVTQTHVERPFADALAAALPDGGDGAALFRFCQPLERTLPPVRMQRLGSDRYLFSSGSTDFRVHPVAVLRPRQIVGLRSFGPVAGALAVTVGFGSNFLTAVRSDNRIVLQNGYHRAYALRAMGYTHAPCAVVTVTRKDELKVAGSDALVEDPQFYFRAARPPLLKDFFDPKLVKTLPVRRMETVIEVEIKMRTSTAADI